MFHRHINILDHSSTDADALHTLREAAAQGAHVTRVSASFSEKNVWLSEEMRRRAHSEPFYLSLTLALTRTRTRIITTWQARSGCGLPRASRRR